MTDYEKLLLAVNKVTAPYRHGNKIPTKALDNLSNLHTELLDKHLANEVRPPCANYYTKPLAFDERAECPGGKHPLCQKCSWLTSLSEAHSTTQTNLS